MDITIDQQVALDEALVPHASRLMIADVPAIHMQEFWATATFHHHSICFKMNNKKHIVNPKYFREMLQICPRIPNQPFDELPFKEEILAFLKELGHSGEIKMITDVNINKLHQPWRLFVAVINKCLSGKSTGYDSLRLSQAQILWGMYHKKNINFAYLLWEDFVYPVEHKDTKKSNEMYYPRLTKVIVNFFITKDQSIPRRNKVNWHFARDDHMFTMIKLVSRHQNTQQYGAEPPKTKASVRKKQSRSDTTVSPPTAKSKRLKTSAKVDKHAKEKQHAKSSKAKDVDDQSDDDYQDDQDEDDDQDDEDDDDDDQTNSDNDGDDFVHPKFFTHNEEDKDKESFDPIVQTPSQVGNTDDEDNDEDSHGMNVEGDEGANEEDDGNELYEYININLEGRDIQMADVQTTQVIKDTHVTLTLVNPEGQQQSSSVSSRLVSNMLNPSPDIDIDFIFESTLRVDVLVTTSAEPPLLTATTLPPPLIPIILHYPDWFRKQAKPPTPDRAWNKTLLATYGRIQPWISNLAKKADSRTLFNELMDNPIDFSVFMMNRLKVDTLTPELLVELQIVKWHNYKHLDWITIRRDDDKLYKFKESDFKRLCIQDIEEMLLLLVQGKLTNLTIKERLAFNVSLRMFTRSIVIQ
nr:hypothetical protein [Tanacetum cinerariifolium]